VPSQISSLQRARCPPALVAALLILGAAAPSAQADRPSELTAPHGLIVGRDAAGVRYVEPNREFRAAEMPADPTATVSRQWALGAIDVLPAWTVPATTAVTVAVLDSGMDVTHPDLAAHVWRNPRPTVGDVNGLNTFDRSGDVRDDWGHGTQVAGVIGAAPASAGTGVRGVAQNVRLMAVKVLDRNGIGSTATVVAGMRYALRHGARVLNLSLAGPNRSRALEDEIRAAQAAGAFVVTAAGNYGRDLAASPAYPASYAEPNVIGVASTGSTGELSGFSNRGGPVALAAPGEEILTTARGGYESFYGTSAAAPHVSGAIALLRSARPDATVAQIRSALRDGAQPIAGLAATARCGLLDVGAAMMRLLAQPVAAPQAAGETSSVRVRVVRRAGHDAMLRWSTAGPAVARVRLVVSGGRPARRQTRVFELARKTWVGRGAPGSYRWRVVALDVAGRSVATSAGRIRVSRR
jgi:subtilisin family serine protease